MIHRLPKFPIWTGLFVAGWLMLFAQGARAADTDTSLNRLIGQIETLFPGLEGYVLAVEGNTLTLDLKRGQAVLPGDTLKLIRYGDDIIHPVTQKVIGRKETDLGEVRVTEIRRDYSLAEVITPGTLVQKGDGVRSRFKKIKILVGPVQKASEEQAVNTDALGLELETRLNRRPKFEVPDFDLHLWMLENGIAPQQLVEAENLARLQAQIEADYLLMTELQSIKGKPALAYRLVSAHDGKVLKQARVLTSHLPPQQAKSSPKAGPTEFGSADEGPVKFVFKQEFEFEVVDLDVGDLNGDGKKELIMIDDHRVMVYKREKNGFKKIGQKVFRKNIVRFLSVDVADINHNGRDEIFVTNHWGDRLSSFVLEVVPGQKKLKTVWDEVNLYFRVIRDFDGKPRLIAQHPAYEAPFKPGLFPIHYRNNRYEKGEELKIPPIRGIDFLVYGMALGNVDSRKNRELIMLDKDYKLRVYSSRGRLLVKSDEYFGHDPRTIDVGIKDQVPGTFEDNPYSPKPVHFRGRLFLTHHNGEKFLLIPRNHRLGGSLIQSLVIIEKCSLVFMQVNREGLSRVFETKKKGGYLAGYVLADSPEGPGHWIHMASVSDAGGVFKGNKITTLYTYFW